MMVRTLSVFLVLVFLSGCSVSSYTQSEQQLVESSRHQGLQMYFGLSKPTGGVITNAQWHEFETKHLAKTFTGFNLVTGAGYYKGKKEGSKIVTLYEVTPNDITAAKSLASKYCEMFNQDSVLIVQLGVEKIMFVSKESS
ncbi:DUF3574 domain-containing protein [Pseudoalteromonas luteoviolacea]|uniref:DUF3574 domain-containing protein n=1 Tax=Pseudoalteromonas luteoviolacea TaxID=43657 RepID=UPI00114FB413|nr:DUF3574 domain-containing protein [Pseudoalteromonas luteoviolacea]TQF70679.1 DUF3574 domain-containing protein [Pseudoalteromonas luteoviolacea]